MSAIVSLSESPDLRALWTDQCREEILRQAMEALRTRTRTDERTIRIFELLAFHQLAPQRIAEDQNVSVNDVYVAKHRCLRKLRAIIAQLDEAFEMIEEAKAP